MATPAAEDPHAVGEEGKEGAAVVVVDDEEEDVAVVPPVSEATRIVAERLGEGATEIPEKAFKGRKDLRGILEIPTTVRTIGGGHKSGAFQGCSNVEEIRIPDSVTELQTQAFYGCSNLRRIELSKSLVTIHPYAFYNCHQAKFYACSSSTTCVVTVSTLAGDAIDVQVALPPARDETAYDTPEQAVAAAATLEQHGNFDAAVYSELAAAVVAKIPAFADCPVGDIRFPTVPVRVEDAAADGGGGGGDGGGSASGSDASGSVRFTVTAVL